MGHHCFYISFQGDIENWNSVHNKYANKTFFYSQEGMNVRGNILSFVLLLTIKQLFQELWLTSLTIPMWKGRMLKQLMGDLDLTWCAVEMEKGGTSGWSRKRRTVGGWMESVSLWSNVSTDKWFQKWRFQWVVKLPVLGPEVKNLTKVRHLPSTKPEWTFLQNRTTRTFSFISSQIFQTCNL